MHTDFLTLNVIEWPAQYLSQVIVGQEGCNAREKCVHGYNIVASFEVTTKAIKHVRLHLDSNQGRQIAGLMLYHWATEVKQVLIAMLRL